MRCSSCGESRPVQPRNSRLMRGTRLYLCEECEGMEPRYLVVIYGRQKFAEGADRILIELIKKRRYRGDEILASELV